MLCEEGQSADFQTLSHTPLLDTVLYTCVQVCVQSVCAHAWRHRTALIFLIPLRQGLFLNLELTGFVVVFQPNWQLAAQQPSFLGLPTTSLELEIEAQETRPGSSCRAEI